MRVLRAVKNTSQYRKERWKRNKQRRRNNFLFNTLVDIAAKALEEHIKQNILDNLADVSYLREDA